MKRLITIVLILTCSFLLFSCNSGFINPESDNDDIEVQNQENLEEEIETENNVESSDATNEEDDIEATDVVNVGKRSIRKSDFQATKNTLHLSLDSSYEDGQILENSISDTTYQLIYPENSYRLIKYEDFDLYLDVLYTIVDGSVITDYSILGIKLKTSEFKVIEDITIGISKAEAIDLLDAYEFEVSDDTIILTLENYELRIQFNQSDTVESIILKNDLYKELPEPTSILREDMLLDDANWLFALFPNQYDPNVYNAATVIGCYTQNKWYSMYDLFVNTGEFRSVVGIESNLLPQDKTIYVYDSNKLVSVANYSYLVFTSQEAVSNEEFLVVFESQVDSDISNILLGTSKQLVTLSREPIIENLGANKLYTIDINNDGISEKFNVSFSIDLGGVIVESISGTNSEYKIHFELPHESYWYNVMFADLNGDDILELICSSGPLERFIIFEYDNGKFVRCLTFENGIN